MARYILERSSAGVFGYSIVHNDVTTQTFFVETKLGVIVYDQNRIKLYAKFKRLAGLAETRAGVRRIGDELNKD